MFRTARPKPQTISARKVANEFESFCENHNIEITPQKITGQSDEKVVMQYDFLTILTQTGAFHFVPQYVTITYFLDDGQFEFTLRDYDRHQFQMATKGKLELEDIQTRLALFIQSSGEKVALLPEGQEALFKDRVLAMLDTIIRKIEALERKR